MSEAFQIKGTQWVGGNTQENNQPARRVLEKLGLTPAVQLHGAVTKDILALESGSKPWKLIDSLERKKLWLKEVFIKRSAVFPYECYYSFPASEELFKEQDIQQWSFYENEAQTRFLITKPDQKKYHYLHTVYPWNDLHLQEGLWETIASDYKKLTRLTDEDTYIWIDLTKQQAQALPINHNFELSSPWILYGMDKKTWANSKKGNKQFQQME